MRGADGNRYTCFAQPDLAQSMDDGALDQRPACACFVCQLTQLLLGHLGITFVVERGGLTPARELAGRPQKERDGARVR